MANFGDNYNYVVSFDTQRLSEAGRATDAVKAFDKATSASAQSAKEASRASERLRDEFGRFVAVGDRAAATAQANASASNAAANSSANFGRVMGGLAPAIAQGAQLFDDLQYGTRAAAGNLNLLISAAGGFTPVAMALGGAVQVLVTLFKDSIDPMLAQAGILDDNLVKGMNRAKEATNAFKDAQADLLATMPNVSQGMKDQLDKLAELSKQMEGTQAKRLMEQAALEETQYRVQELKKSQDDLAEAEKKYAELKAAAEANPDVGIVRLANEAGRDVREARQRMESIGVDRQQFAQDRVARQMARAGSGEDGALEQVARLRNLSNRTGNQDLADLATAIEKTTETYKQMEKDAAEDAGHRRWLQEQRQKAQEEQDQREQDFWDAQRRGWEEAKEKAKEDKQKRERRDEEAAQANDKRLGDMFGGFGDSLVAAASNRMARGQSNEDIGVALMGQVEGTGVSPQDAFLLVLEAIKQANEQRTANAREAAITIQEMMRQQAEEEAAIWREMQRAGWQGRQAVRQMLRGQNPWRNNRPNGL
jgi:hypothetical protein